MDLGTIVSAFKWAVFGVSSLLAIIAALMMVTRRNPIHSALWLIVAFFSLAVIYLTLHAQFIAVAQVMVYAGAIMMLIIFVIMLIQLEIESTKKGRVTGAKVIGAFITVILFFEIAAAFITFPGSAAKASTAVSGNGRWATWPRSGSPFTESTSFPSRSRRSCFWSASSGQWCCRGSGRNRRVYAARKYRIVSILA